MPDLEIDELVERVEEIPYAPWVTERPKPVLSGGMDFSAGAGLSPGDAVATALTTPIHEGGAEERNRWSEFSRVAGHFIRCARSGHYDISTAAGHAYDWMLAEMRPPWPDARFEAEFRGVLHHDVKEKGAIPIPVPITKHAPSSGDPEPAEHRGFSQWQIGRWAMTPPKARRFLVQGLMQAGVVHTLAAEGGAGKTFLCLDLGLGLAAAGTGMEGQQWLGAPITEHTKGGTVVMLTAEDDQHELHIRLADIDPSGALRKAAAERFVVIPLVNAGGSFPLVSHGRGGEPERSRRWQEVVSTLKQIVEDSGWIMAVIIDTLAATLHGEENRSNVITEYLTEASKLCGEFGATVVVTHHIRKQGKDQPIKDAEDMKAAVRGSGAIMGSSRVVLGLWHASDYYATLRSLGEKPQKGICYRFSVLKANNPEMETIERTLLRQPNGLLIDATNQVGKIKESNRLKQMAWLAHAVGIAAYHRQPLSATSKTAGVYARRLQLPAELHHVTRDEFTVLVDRLLKEGKIVQGKLANKKDGYLDVPEGPLQAKQAYEDPGVFDGNWDRWYYLQSTGEIRSKG